MDLENYRKEAENFISEKDKLYYLHFSGQKEEYNISEIYEKYKGLFTKKVIKEIENLRKETKNEERKRLDYLLHFCTKEYIGRKVKKIEQKIVQEEAKSKIKIDDGEVSFRKSKVVVSNEPRQEKRAEIESKRIEKIKKFNTKYKKKWDKFHSISRELGHDSYSQLCSNLMNIDFGELSDLMQNFLNKTEEIYQKAMDKELKEKIGLSLKQAKYYDMDFFSRGKDYDYLFPKEELVNSFGRTCYALGIDLESQKNIHVDIEERDKKSPRAFMCAVKIPDEIYLNIMPTGGVSDYRSFFHEGGHAQHFANVSKKLPFEFKYLGDNAVTEGYAFLFHYIFLSPEWLEDFLRIENTRGVIRYLLTMKFYMLRRYSGKEIYETKFHDGSSIEGKDKIYEDILSSATMFKYTPERYLSDLDEGFYVSSYLRAWLFESQLKQFFEEKYGPRWYADKKVGDLLKEMWYYGQKYDVDEILNQLGLGKLSIEPIINQFQKLRI